jgi:hypothetical protein
MAISVWLIEMENRQAPRTGLCVPALFLLHTGSIL